jgi:O-antigen ligase
VLVQATIATQANLLKFAEKYGIIITLILLPIDRLPYIHYTPFYLGLISLLLLLAATGGRLLGLLLVKDFNSLKRFVLVGFLLALPVLGYALSSTYAIDSAAALSSTKTLLAVVLRAFCFYVLLSIRPELWQLIKKTTYAVTSVVVAYGFFQFLLDIFGAPQVVTDLRKCCTSNNSTYVFPRVYSSALEPLYFDHYLMLPLWLLAFDFWKDKKAWASRYLKVLFILTATLFILTIARSATISLLVAALIFLGGIRPLQAHKPFLVRMVKAWAAALSLAAVLVLLSGVAAIFIPKHSINNATGFSSLRLFGGHAIDVNDGSAQTRYALWPRSVDYIREKPLQGVGADNSRVRLNLDKYRSGQPLTKLQPFNNDLLSLLVDLGLLGLAVFGPLLVLLLVLVVRAYRSAWKPLGAATALVLIGMLLQGNFFQSILLTRVWVVVGLLLACMYAPAKPINKARLKT